jgi:hypothetical protein
MATPTTPTSHGPAVENHTSNCQPASKWLVQINDQPVNAPDRHVKVRVLKEQGSVPDGHILVRDHGSSHDVAFDDDTTIDLGEGNVFYTMPRCEYEPRGGCEAPAKRAIFIDDEPEITLRPDQTGRTLRDLFGLSIAVRLFRDLKSPQDEEIGPDSTVRFEDGPVFYTRRAQGSLTITVNKQSFDSNDGVKTPMTGRQIADLITKEPAEVVWLKGGEELPIELGEPVNLKGCEEFMVTRCTVKGGYEPARIEQEIERLRANGAEVEFVPGPAPAVIFHHVPTRKGYPHTRETDVLVPVPAAYPGAMLDGACLPAGSPLLNKVEGAPQTMLQIGGRSWQLVSYHPHNGGGGPPWNPSRHGFHSYYSEVLAWIQRARN